MTNSKYQIKGISAREILDSRGKSTVEVEMETKTGKFVASCPSGTSIGQHEAKVLPAKKAVKEIKRLAPDLVKKVFLSQSDFDAFLEEQSLFGNVTLPLSIAFCRAFDTLPKPRTKRMPGLLILAFEGGVHSNSSLKIQEFLILAKDVAQGLSLYQKLEGYLKEEGIDTDTGLEGGFAPNNLSDEQALVILRKALPSETKIALDFGGSYYRGSGGVETFLQEFNVFALEDPFGETEGQKWRSLFKKFGQSHLIIGDDLVATNVKILERISKRKMINAVIVKPNQIGTVTKTLDFVEKARQNGLKVIVSHRSGETQDAFIADLALSVESDFVKFGGLNRGERIAKYNQLIQLTRN